jgi:hypothetical protein
MCRCDKRLNSLIRFQHLLPSGHERDQRAGFVLLHQPAIADYISGEDGGEAALGAFFGHVGDCF